MVITSYAARLASERADGTLTVSARGRRSCLAARDGRVHGPGTPPSTFQPRVPESLAQGLLDPLALVRGPCDGPLEVGVGSGTLPVIPGYPGETALHVLRRVSELIERRPEPVVHPSDHEAEVGRHVLE